MDDGNNHHHHHPRADGCENGGGVATWAPGVGGARAPPRALVCVVRTHVYSVLTRFRPEPKSPDQRPRAPTEGHNQWNRLCTDLSRYTRNFSPPSDTSEHTQHTTSNRPPEIYYAHTHARARAQTCAHTRTHTRTDVRRTKTRRESNAANAAAADSVI